MAIIQQCISFVLLSIAAEKTQQTALPQVKRTPMVHVNDSTQMDKNN